MQAGALRPPARLYLITVIRCAANRAGAAATSARARAETALELVQPEVEFRQRGGTPQDVVVEALHPGGAGAAVVGDARLGNSTGPAQCRFRFPRSAGPA